jgi:hypothetical protein
MAEAEDVLLHAAEQVTAATRAWWRRHRPLEGPPGTALVDISRRLSAVIQACFGHAWPLIPSDPDAAPTWLATRLRKLPPWVRDGRAHAFSDGAHIFLPRYLDVFGDPIRETDFLRLTALMLAARLARGSVERCPAHPVARDLFWAVDGAVVEGLLTTEFPNLQATATAARQGARASRPSIHALTSREQAMEQVVRQLLEAPPGEVRRLYPDAPLWPSTPEALARWAGHLAALPPFHGHGSYRGVAPVPHWGRPRPDLLGPPAASRGRPRGSGTHRPPTRAQRLPHRLEPKAVEEAADTRQGPFLVPHGDPQQSVEDPGGLRRPLDQGEEPELEALADELARLGRVPCLESEATVHEILEAEVAQRTE